MTKPLVSYRRIDQLKTIALDCGFTNEDAKQFGKLSKTATWEALLETYGIPLQAVDRTVDNVNRTVDRTVVDTVDRTVDNKFNRMTQADGRTMVPSQSAILPVLTQAF